MRFAQIGLFMIASRDDPGLRHSVLGLAISTGIGTGLLVLASFLDGTAQGAVWALALALDMGGPLLIDSSGWRLEPGHFAERHGLIVIIALGESIVAIGVGAEARGRRRRGRRGVLGVGVAGALWWLYFDVVALVAERRLSQRAAGKVRNEIARDSFSYLHFPMVAGIVLLALGLKKTLEHVDEPLKLVPAVGDARRHRRLPARARRVPLAQRAPLQLAAADRRGRARRAPPRGGRARPRSPRWPSSRALLVVLIVYEAHRFAELRDRLRHQLAHE